MVGNRYGYSDVDNLQTRMEGLAVCVDAIGCYNPHDGCAFDKRKLPMRRTRAAPGGQPLLAFAGAFAVGAAPGSVAIGTFLWIVFALRAWGSVASGCEPPSSVAMAAQSAAVTCEFAFCVRFGSASSGTIA